MYGHQHRGAQAGHQGQQRVTQGQVSDEQQRQAPERGLTETLISLSVDRVNGKELTFNEMI